MREVIAFPFMLICVVAMKIALVILGEMPPRELFDWRKRR